MQVKSKLLISTTSLILAGAAGVAVAGEVTTPAPVDVNVVAPQSSSFGYIGATVNYGYAINTEDSDEYSAIAPSIEGAYAFVLGNGGAFVVDAMVHMDNYDPDMLDNEDPLPQYQASAHYLHPLSDKLVLGGFAGYGVAPFEDDNEVYQVGFVGAGIVYKASDVLSMFGQAAYGTSFDPDAMSSAGFYNGYVLRAGVDYSGLSFATLRAEAEFAATEEYEDSNEPGEMWTVGISAESSLGANENFSVNYGVRYAFYDALNDTDHAAETIASLGVKYSFGGGNASARLAEIGYIGAPYLPLRGSFWTPTMD